MNYNRAEQALAFDRVLPWEGQVPACEIQADGRAFLRLAAPEAQNVSVVIMDEEYPCTRREDGVWEMELPFRTGHHYVQFKLDGAEVLTPLLPISYGYSRPYNYVELPVPKKTGSTGDRGDALSEGQCGEKLEEVSGDDFYQIKDVPHGSVRREYFYSSVTGEWESCVIYTPAAYEEETDKTFPVLYLQHGHGENETGWTTAGKLQFILDNLIAEGKAVPFAVVMCKRHGADRHERRPPYRGLHAVGAAAPQRRDPFRGEKNSASGGSKERRAMAGLSMGFPPDKHHRLHPSGILLCPWRLQRLCHRHDAGNRA